eukprot:239853-Prorocentrum_minimum.AAC.1
MRYLRHGLLVLPEERLLPFLLQGVQARLVGAGDGVVQHVEEVVLLLLRLVRDDGLRHLQELSQPLLAHQERHKR